MLLGVVSLRAGTKIHYDGEAMRVTNVAAANDFLRREYPAGVGSVLTLDASASPGAVPRVGGIPRARTVACGDARHSSFRRSGPIRRPAAESAMRVCRRRSRVASCFALTTHQRAVLR